MVAVPSLLLNDQQPGGGQAAHVPVGGLRSDGRRPRQLSRGQGPSVHRRCKHIGAGRVAH